MKKGILIVFLLLAAFIVPFYCWAQTEKLTYQSTSVGFGSTEVYDTYLSPLKYTGSNLGLMYERMNMTGLMSGNISGQHLLNVEVAKTNNQTGTTSNYWGNLQYIYGLHYRFQPIQKLQLFAGTQADALIGAIYNTRNGNNPASAKANLNLNLSGIAAYSFKIKQQPVLVRYQLNIPFMGMLFAPQFGQSYYEMSLGVNQDLVHFASFHNQLAMRNLLSFELPFNFCTLRLSYLNWIYESKVNDLDTRIMSNSIYVGISKNFLTVSGRKKNNYKTVFD